MNGVIIALLVILLGIQVAKSIDPADADKNTKDIVDLKAQVSSLSDVVVATRSDLNLQTYEIIKLKSSIPLPVGPVTETVYFSLHENKDTHAGYSKEREEYTVPITGKYEWRYDQSASWISVKSGYLLAGTVLKGVIWIRKERE
jgi:hypothetical protein